MLGRTLRTNSSLFTREVMRRIALGEVSLTGISQPDSRPGVRGSSPQGRLTATGSRTWAAPRLRRRRRRQGSCSPGSGIVEVGRGRLRCQYSGDKAIETQHRAITKVPDGEPAQTRTPVTIPPLPSFCPVLLLPDHPRRRSRRIQRPGRPVHPLLDCTREYGFQR